ncbi:uncharacterized protein TERG_05659 [Trichophyton rubrum CBS 118892]|uniref:Uncharacterized protein n=1 Tax=Trichophyton rubrum (strain ATCC MYA-4607 / CBS 118892) TaxID=559305 RepID=F2ST58_TRIRC|nr:uncharacterized protein TERG_05659 [Trichophyton rubrum CBS 118892]XP_047606659.1 uncharacterized protein TERG_05659 [Trichophyton rubrum CBS 118892]EGD89418.2 hypothetical protein TERG_05659 [Trichophyton rubrum CBS 118892]KFL62027.1 hypothetical protein TERG_05659 [Trichophyton rubrum CBS 118892]
MRSKSSHDVGAFLFGVPRSAHYHCVFVALAGAQGVAGRVLILHHKLFGCSTSAGHRYGMIYGLCPLTFFLLIPLRNTLNHEDAVLGVRFQRRYFDAIDVLIGIYLDIYIYNRALGR